MGATLRLRVAPAAAALLLLAAFAARVSPGFPLAPTPTMQAQLHLPRGRGGAEPTTPPPPAAMGSLRPSRLALDDIPARYLQLYLRAGTTCRPLRWQLLAGIGKVESDHGRSRMPGVHSGTNRKGAAGPMQFGIGRGPAGNAWAIYGHGDVYDPGQAIPAAARYLCANGLRDAHAAKRDPCPQVGGSAATHLAVRSYNHACWYVHEVVSWALRYTAAPAAAHDPFVEALAHNPRIATTTSRGCDPASDLMSDRLDLRVQSILAVIADRYTIRISCLRTGHSDHVRGTRRVSNHTVWRAVDIDMVNGQAVSPSSGAAHSLVVWLDGLQGLLRPTEVGSPWILGHRPYFSDDGHRNHIHIGFGTESPGE
jgi:hypothetical protein